MAKGAAADRNLSLAPKDPKKPGCKSPLSSVQKNLVNQHLPGWEAVLTKNRLHLGKPSGKSKDPKEVTDWLDATIEAIVAKPEFRDVDETIRNKAEWSEIIRAYFKNHRNNVFIKKNVADLVAHTLATDTDSSIHKDLVAAANVVLLLQSPAAGKDLFCVENEAAIKTLATEKFNDTSAPGQQRALSKLWKNAQDQGDYNKRAETVDIFNNTLGPAEMVLLTGFRDEQDNMKYRRLSKFLKPGAITAKNVFLVEHVKQETAAKDQTILHNLSSVPVLKKLNLDNLSPKQTLLGLRTVNDHLSHSLLLKQTRRTSLTPRSSAFLPVILKAVEMLDIDAQIKLAAYLMTILSVDHPEPFMFHEKADISARVEARRVKEEAEHATSDSPTPPSTLKSPTATPKSPPPTQKLLTPTLPPPPVSSLDTATIAKQGSSAHPVGPTTAEDIPTVSSSLVVTQGNDADQSANDNPPPPMDPSMEESPRLTNLTETATGMEVDAHAGAVVPTQLRGRKQKCKEPASEDRNTRARVQAQPTRAPTPQCSVHGSTTAANANAKPIRRH
ncbi:hypothetical protein BT96DRAFT_946807 [Gymnopus androsaceus JB14]|uniref:Uncharacterized protein n=1 Tax=Gymnopus androsaceus JB14 TaxID=1447944 RepID=A0A6A4GWV6_9AGAR|nr:hypothetical protein BT96DRAFT_946807 [Gymnopus androsaceus JB14]